MGRDNRREHGSFPKLTESNYVLWHRHWRARVGEYGDAGDEVLSEEYFDVDGMKPQYEDYVTKTVHLGNGEIRESERDPDAAKAEYMFERGQFEKRLRRYEEDRRLLCSDLFKTMSREVMERIQGRTETYEAILRTHDSLALYKMAKRVTRQLAKRHRVELLVDLIHVKHDLQGEHVRSYLQRFEDARREMEHAGVELGDTDLAYLLAKGVSRSVFETVVGEAYTKEPEELDYPSYKKLRDNLERFDNDHHVAGVYVQGGKKKDSDKPSMDVHPVLQSLEKVSQEGRALVAGAQDGKKMEHHRGNKVCRKCGRRGHFAAECRATHIKPSYKAWLDRQKRKADQPANSSNKKIGQGEPGRGDFDAPAVRIVRVGTGDWRPTYAEVCKGESTARACYLVAADYGSEDEQEEEEDGMQHAPGQEPAAEEEELEAEDYQSSVMESDILGQAMHPSTHPDVEDEAEWESPAPKERGLRMDCLLYYHRVFPENVEVWRDMLPAEAFTRYLRRAVNIDENEDENSPRVYYPSLRMELNTESVILGIADERRVWYGLLAQCYQWAGMFDSIADAQDYVLHPERRVWRDAQRLIIDHVKMLIGDPRVPLPTTVQVGRALQRAMPRLHSTSGQPAAILNSLRRRAAEEDWEQIVQQTPGPNNQTSRITLTPGKKGGSRSSNPIHGPDITETICDEVRPLPTQQASKARAVKRGAPRDIDRAPPTTHTHERSGAADKVSAAIAAQDRLVRQRRAPTPPLRKRFLTLRRLVEPPGHRTSSGLQRLYEALSEVTIPPEVAERVSSSFRELASQQTELHELLQRGELHLLRHYPQAEDDRGIEGRVNMVRAKEKRKWAEEWVLIASGATHHIEPEVGDLGEYLQPENNGMTVRVADDRELRVRYKGRVPGLGNTLVVPEIGVPLLSVRQLTELDYTVEFLRGQCAIKHRLLDAPVYGVLRDQHSYYVRRFDVSRLMTLKDSWRPTALTVTPPLTHFSREQVQRAKRVRMWHEYTMHPSTTAMSTALNNGCVLGCDITETDIKNADKIFGECPYCIMGKITSPAFPHSDRPPANAPGEVIHADILPLSDTINETNGKHVAQFGLVGIDEHTGYMFFTKLDSKQRKDVHAGLMTFRTETMRHGHRVLAIQTDSESVLVSCIGVLAELNIKMLVVPSYQHAQRIERAVRVLKDRERCVLAATPVVIPRSLQGEVYRAIVTHLNDLPRTTAPTTTPRILFTGTKLNLEDRLLIPLGTPIMINRARAEHSAGEPRALLGLALGPVPHTARAIYAYVFATGRVIVSSDQVIFSEVPADFPLAKNTLYSPLGNRLNLEITAEFNKRNARRADEDRPLRSPVLMASYNVKNHATGVTLSPRSDQRGAVQQTSEPTDLENIEAAPSQTNESTVKETDNIVGSGTDTVTDTNDPSDVDKTDGKNDNPTTSTDGEHQESRPDGTGEQSPRYKLRKRIREMRETRSGANRIYGEVFRITVKAALNSNMREATEEAIKTEIQNMRKYHVGHFVKHSDIPPNLRRNIVRSFMFIKHKTNPDGSYDKTKARLVTNGAQQGSHLYDMVASATVVQFTVYVLINVALYKRRRLKSYDVVGAFLHVEFVDGDPAIYVRIDKDVASLWVTIDRDAAPYLCDDGTLIMLLDRYLYGLKQSPLKFMLDLQEVLLGLNYVQSTSDPCLYIKWTGEQWSYVSTHVDDLLQVASDDWLYDELEEALVRRYGNITPHDPAEAYLGLQFTRSADLSTITLTQTGLANDCVEACEEAYGPADIARSPATQSLFASEADQSPRKEDGTDGKMKEQERRIFLAVLMKMMYLARLSRPDLLLALSYLASKSHRLESTDIEKLKRVAGYIKHTYKIGVTMKCEGLQVIINCDASYGIHDDGKSHTGYRLGLGPTNSYVLARSVKQSSVATSSTDAEILAPCDAVKTGVWVRNLLKELALEEALPIVLQQDNRSAIKLVTQPTKSTRSRHILIKLAYVRELIQEGTVNTVWLSTVEMLADMLTKPVIGQAFINLARELLGLIFEQHQARTK